MGRLRAGRLSQKQLANEIMEQTGISVVTCGKCPGVFLARIRDEIGDDHRCPYCGTEEDISIFPDLIYDCTDWEHEKYSPYKGPKGIYTNDYCGCFYNLNKETANG